MITEAQANRALIYGAIPVLMGATNVAVVRFGHAFALFTKVGLFSGGIIGVVQGLASQALYHMIANFLDSAPVVIDEKYLIPIAAASIFTANVACAALLFTISIIAVKVGIIGSSLALSGIVFLTLANTALSIAGLMFHALALNELKKRNLMVQDQI